MEIEELKRELRRVIRTHKHKLVGVGEIRADCMARDCLDAIEKLQGQNVSYGTTERDACYVVDLDQAHKLREYVLRYGTGGLLERPIWQIIELIDDRIRSLMETVDDDDYPEIGFCDCEDEQISAEVLEEDA